MKIYELEIEDELIEYFKIYLGTDMPLKKLLPKLLKFLKVIIVFANEKR